ncbi:MAG: hypothetical protein ABI627_17695 [Polyangiaceae bacterium]
MKASPDTQELTLSATDLSGFSECKHKTTLDLAVAFGTLKRPGENEIERKMLEKRGFEHEARVRWPTRANTLKSRNSRLARADPGRCMLNSGSFRHGHLNR